MKAELEKIFLIRSYQTTVSVYVIIVALLSWPCKNIYKKQFFEI